jgi:2'-5' RNA ligase
VRLFFGVELPDEVRAAIGRLRPGPEAPGAADYRWVDPALLHVTLAFLGERPADLLPTLSRVGAAVAAAAQPTILAIGKAGAFGSSRAPRVLWVGLGGDLAELNRLQASLVSALREQGVELDEADFRPHITLARRRPAARPGTPLPWPPRKPLAARTVPLDSFSLIHSQLGGGGPRYVPLERFALGPR